MEPSDPSYGRDIRSTCRNCSILPSDQLRDDSMKPHPPNDGFQPFRELEWLADFFANHATEAVAQTVFKQLVDLRKAAQSQLAQSLDEPDKSNVIQMFRKSND